VEKEEQTHPPNEMVAEENTANNMEPTHHAMENME
jgi:hypothetical protein